MKPLIVLISVFILALLVNKYYSNNYNPALSGRIALSVMLLFTASAHFAFSKGMVMMLPDFVPNKLAIVYFTGVIEILAAIGLLIPHFRVATGWLLIVFFVLIIPANVYAAIKQVNYQKTNFDGNGMNYLWFRVPLQILFIGWTYLSAIGR